MRRSDRPSIRLLLRRFRPDVLELELADTASVVTRALKIASPATPVSEPLDFEVLRAPESREFRECMAAEVSVDLCGSLGAVPVRGGPVAIAVPKIRDADEYLWPRVKVSRDLNVPLTTAEAAGARYGQHSMIGGAPSDSGDLVSGVAPKKPSKAYKTHKLPGRIVRQTLSVWDLLLPLLQPPIRLDVPERCDLPHSLYHYQVDGIQFLCEGRSALLADEMGTGKTVMSTVAMRLQFRAGRVSKALVICPLSLLSVWDKHIAEWAPELSRTVVHGDVKTRWADWRCPAHVYITTYDVMRGDALAPAKGEDPLLPRDMAASFDLVLLDEAQNIKNENSGRTRAVRSLQPRYRWALSGTPIENRIEDLVSLFSFVRPGLLPKEGLTPELASDLIGPYMKRRTKREVMKELPDKVRQDEWLEMDEGQLTAYRALEAKGAKDLEDLGDKVSRMHIFTLISQLKMICNFAPGAEDSPKLRLVKSKVEEIKAIGKKVLIFTQWVELGIKPIEKALREYGVVTFDGGMSKNARDAAVEKFRTDPDATVFLATVKSAGVGLTLTEASYVIHFDHWWNPAWMWQAEDRAHRRGQTEPVNVYSLWMQDSIEARVSEILQKKGCLHEEIVDGLAEGAIDGLISVQEWLQVLGVQG